MQSCSNDGQHKVAAPFGVAQRRCDGRGRMENVLSDTAEPYTPNQRQQNGTPQHHRDGSASVMSQAVVEKKALLLYLWPVLSRFLWHTSIGPDR